MGLESLVGIKLTKEDKEGMKTALKGLPIYIKKMEEIDKVMSDMKKDLDETKKFCHTIFNILILKIPKEELNTPDMIEAISVIEEFL